MDWQVSKMLTLTFIRDDLRKFIFGGSYADSAEWGITKVEGLGTIEYEITTEENAVGDGEEITGCRVPARAIDITANVKNKKNNKHERSKAISFFNPKHSFTLYVNRDNDIRWIVAMVEKFQCPEASGKQELSIALKCTDPYFYSYDNYGKNIAEVRPMFGFPYISPIGKGFNVGIYNFKKQVEISNTGDVETYCTIRIEANGEVINPKIMIGDAYIRLLDVLEERDRIDIDMVQNTIRKNGVNCIKKVDRRSMFSRMVLAVGSNIVSFTADNGDTNMKVVLYYNLRYLGA